MGYAKARIILTNAANLEGPAFEVDASVDPGAMLLCIPQGVADELGLDTSASRAIIGPDGETHVCPYAGPLRIDFEDRISYAGALVLGEGVWLGAVQMADMDLIIDPALGRVVVNPEALQTAETHTHG